MKGKRLYTSWYTEGVVIWNTGKPARPKKIGQFTRPEKGEDPFGLFFPDEEYVELWGVDIGSGYVVASDMNTGLQGRPARHPPVEGRSSRSALDPCGQTSV